MNFLSSKLTFLILGFCLLFFFGGASACGQKAEKSDFTKADFEKLHWLEGVWRGTDARGQNPFFERYHFAGDGKIETDSFSDAALNKVDSQSSTYFENGEIIHRSGAMTWTASRVEDAVIEFVPKEKATNSFTWKKESPDAWTAKLTGKDAQGKPTETIYRMERIKQ